MYVCMCCIHSVISSLTSLSPDCNTCFLTCHVNPIFIYTQYTGQELQPSMGSLGKRKQARRGHRSCLQPDENMSGWFWSQSTSCQEEKGKVNASFRPWRRFLDSVTLPTGHFVLKKTHHILIFIIMIVMVISHRDSLWEGVRRPTGRDRVKEITAMERKITTTKSKYWTGKRAQKQNKKKNRKVNTSNKQFWALMILCGFLSWVCLFYLQLFKCRWRVFPFLLSAFSFPCPFPSLSLSSDLQTTGRRKKKQDRLTVLIPFFLSMSSLLGQAPCAIVSQGKEKKR